MCVGGGGMCVRVCPSVVGVQYLYECSVCARERECGWVKVGGTSTRE